ncbi:MAG: SGNH/GDSL hydrolase family protein [Clostridiales bacterium]|nr:SGNH/GDSL hydrolase family protein [Clostridiales bacterium]
MAMILTNLSTINSNKNTKNRKLSPAQLVLCLLALIALLLLLNRLFSPKYMSGVYEGALIAEYYNSDKNHALIVIGDCEVYENISPITLWEDYGITSYIRGSPQQLIWQSYYLLEDTLRYEKPQAVIFSVLAMKYATPQSEAYNRLTLDGMKLSRSKIAAVYASMTPGESLFSYLFPLFRYHDRYTDIGTDDLLYLFSRRGVSHNGFMMRCDTKPLTTLPTPQKLADYQLDATCWHYLDKMREKCGQQGVELILLKAPLLYPHWYDEWDAQIVDYASTHGLLYINALTELAEIGLDFTTDTYDGGLHLNLAGAEKFSKYLGTILSSRGWPDLRLDEKLSISWAEKSLAYERMKNAQISELETKGKINTFIKE